MSFAAPIALTLAALAVPIIGLYILKVRLRRIPVSTNMFWRQVYDEKPPRSLWQNLRHWLSLLAQLLLLALLVLAVADPYLAWQAARARRMVIVIDTSASMQATDVEPTRFDLAIDEAHRVVDGVRDHDQVAIVSAGSVPKVVTGMANHAPTLRRALDSIRPTDAPSSIDSAAMLGRQLIGDHPHGVVVVISDGTQEVPADVDQRFVGTPARNLGITQLQTRRSFVDPVGYEVLVEVKNASDEPARGRLELELDGVPIDVLPFDLEPDQSWARTIEKTSLEGGELTATLTQLAQPDYLSTDDTAWGIVPPRELQKVLIVSPGNLFLQKVFEANPLVRVTIADEIPATWPDDTIVVLHRLVPEQMPANDFLMIDPESSSDLWDVGGLIANPIVTEQDETSPLMTYIRLDNVLVPEARQLQFKGDVHALAATVSDDPIYVSLDRDGGKALVLSVNLEQSDLAFRTAFPILITNSLAWFADQSGELEPAIASGEMASVKFSTDDKRTLVSPSGERSPVSGDLVGPLAEVGIWSVQGNITEKKVAVNLANAVESDLRPAAATQVDRPSSTAAFWFTRPIWFYCACLALFLLVVEWFLYQRRLIG